MRKVVLQGDYAKTERRMLRSLGIVDPIKWINRARNPRERARRKTAAFGIMYGASPGRLSDLLSNHPNPRQAKKMLNRLGELVKEFKKTFPALEELRCVSGRSHQRS